MALEIPWLSNETAPPQPLSAVLKKLAGPQARQAFTSTLLEAKKWLVSQAHRCQNLGITSLII